ncbi:hypothetical protein [Nocardia transvalensis]|uniref:hypothetical protein n=1 Tax=Nocardia transvalensis TaxID=37333 RepID=UPI001894C9CE|nr:hypothetical protein [Nocardia transvalensis]MBF6328757.1 hypothetical protein [Nocardia transvalensis]
MTGSVQVIVRGEIRTTVGTLAPGMHAAAFPSGDGGWLAQVAEPVGEGRSRLVVVAGRKVKRRKAVTPADIAHEEYEFARTILGYSHTRALAWLMDAYGVTERSLFRWGFSNPRTGAV